jgi:hypothetical protein
MRLFLPLVLAFALAQSGPQPPPTKELLPRPVTFSKAALPLQQALEEIAQQTGNTISDQRGQRTSPVVKLPAGPVLFWPAIDAIGKATGVGFSPFLGEGEIGLTTAPYRSVPHAYSGLFRISQRRVALTLDEETQAHHCRLALDIAWEPRFRPFYVDLRQLKLIFAPDAKGQNRQETLPAHGPVGAAGRCAVELDVLTGAPDRSSPRIASVDGVIWAAGPSKMLTFEFAKLTIQKAIDKGPAVPAATQEGVTVTITSLRRQTDALLVTVEIENPKSAVNFDTHQTWLTHNRIALRQRLGGKERVVEGTSIRETMRGTRATVEYEFPDTPERPLPKTLDGWTLSYVTSGRIVELTAPFTLRDLALP